MFKKDLLWVETENNKISTKFLVSVGYSGTSSWMYFGYENNNMGSITPTSWEGHFISELSSDRSGTALWVDAYVSDLPDTSISITRLDTNKTISGEKKLTGDIGRALVGFDGGLFTSSDVGSIIEIEIWYKIEPKSDH